jgi:ribosomal protein S18 acetylase RimI-like enzyme
VSNNSEEKIEIRSFKDSDLKSLYKICLLTGDSGKDATSIYEDPQLLGHFYAAPYAKLEPELTFILTLDHVPSGYIIGALDSQKFYEKCEKSWFPNLRKKYKLPDESDSSPDANIIRLIHKGHVPNPELSEYPSHLHIDLLPITQGKGLGRIMMNRFIEKLKELNSPALHLEVGKKNSGAIVFYKKMGFHIIKEFQYSIAFGMKFR